VGSARRSQRSTSFTIRAGTKPGSTLNPSTKVADRITVATRRRPKPAAKCSATVSINPRVVVRSDSSVAIDSEVDRNTSLTPPTNPEVDRNTTCRTFRLLEGCRDWQLYYTTPTRELIRVVVLQHHTNSEVDRNATSTPAINSEVDRNTTSRTFQVLRG
jgi:hypothetical protein